MRLILTILLIGLFKADAQMVINASAPYRPMAVAGGLLLDDYSGAAAAYSLRKLRTAYTGAAIRVRKDTTGQPEQDVNFIGNELDTASLKSFLNARNGFVVTWYDQSGNGRNASQSTQANQPRIANLGVIERQNSKVTIFFDNANDGLSITSGLDIAKNISSAAGFTVYRNITSPTAIKGLFQISTNVDTRRLFMGSGLSSGKHTILWRILDTDGSSSLNSISNVSTTNYALLTALFQYSINDFFIYINNILDNSGTNAGGSNTSNTNSLNATIGGFGATTSNMNITEIVIYNTDQASNRTGIETNINNYYSIY